MALLEVDNLQTHFRTPDGVNRAVDGISFAVEARETVAIVGESGCGKSVTANSILRLVPQPPGRIGGAIRFQGRDLLKLNERAMREVRGNDISMIFQEPMTSLNPVLTIGRQIAEPLRLHQGLSRESVEQRVVEMLGLVGIAEPRRRAREYPHQLSGGMRQRVMIAIALACRPKLLIADEATTALDVTTQAQIMELLLELQDQLNMALIMISHDLGLAASYADEVIVMYAGKIVEQAPASRLFGAGGAVRMRYTRALLDAIPHLERPAHTLLPIVGGRPPDPTALPPGCSFAPRCAYAEDDCRAKTPALAEHSPGHRWACWHPCENGGAA